MVHPTVLVQGVTLLGLGLAAPALACPVCGVGQGGAASVYLMTAAVMSVVPVLMCGAVVYYLSRRVRRDQDEVMKKYLSLH